MLVRGGMQRLRAPVRKGWLLPRDQSPAHTPGVSLANLYVSGMPFCTVLLSPVYFSSWFLCPALCQQPRGCGGGPCERDRILFFPQARNCFSITCTSEHLLSR